MKLKFVFLAAFSLAQLSAFQSEALAQGTAFTYQGRLDAGSSPANGSFDLRVAVFDAASGGNQRGLLTNNAVGVSNGLFTTTLDFGLGVFSGGPRWLEFAVRSNGTAAAFTPLSPRQAVSPAPYAFWAANASQAVTVSGTVPTSGLNGLYSNPISFNNPANGFVGDGGGLKNVNAAQLGGLTVGQFWQTGGNAGANPTNNAFIGTSDNLPLEFRVNGQRALRLEPGTNSLFSLAAVNVIGGSAANTVSDQTVGAFIGGGGSPAFPNRVTASYGSVLGGFGNVAGGVNSTAFGNQSQALGPNSTAFGSGCVASHEYALAMGAATAAEGASSTAMGLETVATGQASTAMGRTTIASGSQSTAMGESTRARGDASTAMGRSTIAGGSASTAMGYRARAFHDGSFAWADTQEADFSSTASNQFSIRASGGVRLNNDTSLNFGNKTRQMLNLWDTGYGIGVQSDAQYFRSFSEFMWYRGGSHSDAFGDPGSGGTQLMRLGSTGNLVIAGTLSQGSDRNVKSDFVAVDAQEVLAKVAALPIQSWSYTNDVSRRHIGPVAQDFHAAFGLNGTDDKHIATVDADGVALAAIQGLNQKLTEELKRRDSENASLRERLERLEGLLRKLSDK